MDVEIQELIQFIEHLMYGHNYQVTLGLDVFDGNSTKDFSKQLKAKYSDSNPLEHYLRTLTEEDFWIYIKENLDYRGDAVSGLTLNVENELKLEQLQKRLFHFIAEKINNETKFYSYEDIREPDGIPGYFVYWQFRLVVVNMQNKIIFFYGSSSD